MNMRKQKIIVVVNGGLVQAVHTNIKSPIEVEVLDYDRSDFPEPGEYDAQGERERRLEAEIKDMRAIY